MAELTFVGTGEAFDAALPNTSLLYSGRRTLLLDCGYGVPHALFRTLSGADAIDGIYVTHLHADHSFGLPALLLWMREEGRTRPLRVFGGPGVARWLKKLLELGYPGSFSPERCYPIEPYVVSPAHDEHWEGLGLRCAESDHSVRNLSLRIEGEGRSLCYSGDGAPSAATRALYQGADVLVHECYSAESKVEGHSTASEVLELAEDCRVRRLFLLHIGRRDKERVRAIAASHEGSVRVLIPAPGERIVLDD